MTWSDLVRWTLPVYRGVHFKSSLARLWPFGKNWDSDRLSAWSKLNSHSSRWSNTAKAFVWQFQGDIKPTLISTFLILTFLTHWNRPFLALCWHMEWRLLSLTFVEHFRLTETWKWINIYGKKVKCTLNFKFNSDFEFISWSIIRFKSLTGWLTSLFGRFFVQFIFYSSRFRRFHGMD